MDYVIYLALNLLLALVVILLGFLVAKALEILTAFVVKTIQLDTVAQKLGFNKLLEKADIKKPLSELLGNLVYWLVIFILITSLGTFFGLAVEMILLKIFSYMAVVLLAALVLGVGLFFAALISGISRVVMVNLGIAGAKTASRFIYYIVIVFTFLAALAELGINTKVFADKMEVFIGAFGLAAAIAFGLGCKDMAADFIHDLFRGK
ncbi:hypothetical protein A2291_05050 [candidate division WOR-1 bacterium RIFOXYB2_FULL_42_35]|uniref:Small-conductance mechanosensitive ion channel n=1 Tax=candidate division WOR-1 bacterium RIFOXYC2_FULL_41_25 TaxID=1802586 RepID=A0A1F4TMY4_UNCSA|nr:MAG: hypothetical protein A2247_00470 [candidate division WOR-1 bacterium RIFOXYA2_FULL_41_14]OGC24468.1 MAG: hypothetical protein A2291_05050 [candidate division WOR-1 bacterium RIFOXYB2_FULL_42_35]OGC34085.1 MAG: hypothetical protein A2462_00910 [candidate division WOR-1 bacterium RIFOXYC2_FULL_41_25]OGC43090.1 MAG: hypothetical protein A2548_03155 [candidate division WOR-1 bacterium RIFOXYD2_FULL_41_8]